MGKNDLFFHHWMEYILPVALLSIPNSSNISSPHQSTDSKKKNFTNYRVFRFWLANHLKEEGLIGVETCNTLNTAQKTFEAKDAQEEFYGKFFAVLAEVTKSHRMMLKKSR